MIDFEPLLKKLLEMEQCSPELLHDSEGDDGYCVERIRQEGAAWPY